MNEPHFVVQNGSEFLVCKPIEFAQAGRSHRVLARCGSDFDAWDIAHALDNARRRYLGVHDPDSVSDSSTPE